MKADDLTSSRFVLDTKTTADLRAKMKADPKGGLKEAAQQFESMVLQMMMKSMRDTVAQDGLMDSDQTRFYTSILDQQMAQNLSSKGALGFAKLIEQQLGRNLPAAAGETGETGTALEALQASLAQRQAAISAAAAAGTGAARVYSAPSVQSDAADTAAPDFRRNRDFANRLWPYASEAAATLGVQPQFVLAHAALESGWGRSEIRLADGRSSYNLFGVKAGRSWNGPSVEVQTTEYVGGEAQTVRERFRVYGSYSEAFRDYASLLRNNSRFSGVVGQQDGIQFARSLQQGGYATDPAYADKLGRIINGPSLRQALIG
ncbi:flagellar assembly peptidoglycan hydrolase FlgJ [uncultured Propionivibrio sp.]|uniref:flagellar assembly peptidoglycan hydrolase FlgJ n=1 Tax=uncultured Propionivibrio sp. TaxID=426737 RepID=UPI0029C069DD|nr:flagellar assembly peptidoglycan hydrolase FlgJ [uncultured Propionivibrio sp.]